MTALDTAALRKVAEAATPGPWWVNRDDAEMVWYGDEALTYRLDGNPDAPDADWDAWEASTGQLSHGDIQRSEDAAHIATFDPPTVLALLDEVDDLRAKVARVEAILAEPDDTQWWPVEPYMDPHDEDEVTEVKVVNVDRLRAALDGA